MYLFFFLYIYYNQGRTFLGSRRYFDGSVENATGFGKFRVQRLKARKLIIAPAANVDHLYRLYTEQIPQKFRPQHINTNASFETLLLAALIETNFCSLKTFKNNEKM